MRYVNSDAVSPKLANIQPISLDIESLSGKNGQAI